MKVSVIIPVLDERDGLPATVAALEALTPSPHEIIVSDGGSTDGTREWLLGRVAGGGVAAVDAPRGRGPQMNEGARRATGDALVFLHGDARLPPGALASIARTLEDPAVTGGAFTVRFARGAGSPRSMRLVAAGINARTVLTKTATGDQAIFTRRALFETLGGYAPWPLFEDCDLVDRLKARGRFAILRGPVTISDRRYARFGPWRTTALMWRLRLRYWAGESPERLKRAFSDVR